MNNTPSQLENMRIKSQNQLYSRNPQLMQRLTPFMNQANTVIKNEGRKINQNNNNNNNNATPIFQNHESMYLESPITQEPNKMFGFKKIKNLNKTRNKKSKKLKNPKLTKISEIPADILMGLQ